MAKVSITVRCASAVLATTIFYIAIAYFILRPLEWRASLLHLFLRSFNNFTAMQSSNGPGWIISVIVSSLFTITFTLALVGAIRGRDAMRQHLVETTVIALLAVVGQVVLLYGPIYLRSLARTVYEDHQSLAAAARLAEDKNSGLVDPKSRDDEIAVLKKQLDDYKKAGSSAVRIYPISHDLKPGVPKLEYLMTTGKIRTPVEVLTTCDFPISSGGARFLTLTGGSAETTNDQRISEKQFRFVVLSPAWSPSMPLWVTVFFGGTVDRMPSCTFQVQ